MQSLRPPATRRKTSFNACKCAVLQEMGIVMLEEDYKLLLAEDQRTLGKAAKSGPSPAAASQPVRLLATKWNPTTKKSAPPRRL